MTQINIYSEEEVLEAVVRAIHEKASNVLEDAKVS